MDLLIGGIIFISGMVGCLIIDVSMIYPLLFGLLIFSFLSLRKGFSLKEILKMIASSFKDSFIVIQILLLIGCLTGLWRISGTIAYFVNLGVSVIPSAIFVLAAFILTALMSFALGTSFGVTATAGVILMSIGRAGGVNPVIAAGAVMSGVYIGDRGSPAASSGNLVAVLTHTNMNDNVKIMAKDSLLAIILCVLIYGILSVFNPMASSDVSVLKLLQDNFVMSPLCLIPAVIMVILPLLKVSIKTSMLISMAISAMVAVFIQSAGLNDLITTLIKGYSSTNIELSVMLNGGGLSSMIEVCLILLISGTYGGIFKGTGMLKNLDDLIKKMSSHNGRYMANLILSVIICAVFCNQTIGIMMQNQLNDSLYNEDENKEKMLDIEDSVVLIAGLVPWCIACSVPLSMLGVTSNAIVYSCYLYLLPLTRILKRA